MHVCPSQLSLLSLGAAPHRSPSSGSDQSPGSLERDAMGFPWLSFDPGKPHSPLSLLPQDHWRSPHSCGLYFGALMASGLYLLCSGHLQGSVEVAMGGLMWVHNCFLFIVVEMPSLPAAAHLFYLINLISMFAIVRSGYSHVTILILSTSLLPPCPSLSRSPSSLARDLPFFMVSFIMPFHLFTLWIHHVRETL